MQNKKKHIISIIIFFVIIFTMSTCKKYPENTVWFKNKNKLFIFEPYAKLTGFTVNGIDSLNSLNNYFAWNSITKDINQTFFHEYADPHYGGGTTVKFQFISYSNGVEYGVTYSKNRKKITFYYRNSSDTSNSFRRNIFIDNEPWQIVKLVPKGIKKIKKIINGNTYELQFEPK